LRKLTDQGKSIIFITHKLKEVMRFSDRITVMRGGRNVLVTSPSQTDEAQLATQMVGREISLTIERKPAETGQDILSIDDLCAVSRHGVQVVDRVSLHVRKGEILGLAGVQGNGQGELIACITGCRRPPAGALPSAPPI
jgi:ABC-type uncharacterized transport system ATPase subunit